MRIHCLQHVEYRDRAYLPEWAAATGVDWNAVVVPEEGLPAPGDFDALVIMGGPMSVWQEPVHPWLALEKRLLRQVLEADKPVLGICLGAQLLAEVLGGRVYPGEHKEIGWFEARATTESDATVLAGVLPDAFETFFWHGDTFDLPQGATPVAASAAFPNQAFCYGRAVGLQFHLEVTPQWVRRLAERDADELVPAPFIQPASEILGRPDTAYTTNNALMSRLLARLLGSDPGSEQGSDPGSEQAR